MNGTLLSLALSPMLEFSGVIMAHCKLKLLGASDPLSSPPETLGLKVYVTSSSYFFLIFGKTGSVYVAQDCFLLPASRDPLPSTSPFGGIRGVSHLIQFLKFLYTFLDPHF